MPFPFVNTNGPMPGNFAGIDAVLSPYNTGEAAESDFSRAPQARNYLNTQYQALTGDAFADPIEDNKRRRFAAIMSTIDRGKTIGPSGMPISTVSTASGSNLGPSILGVSPNSPLIQGPPSAGTSNESVATLQSNPQQQQPNYFDMAMSRNPLPEEGSKYLGTQKRRIAETGTYGIALFNALKSDNQDALIPKDYSKQELQLDEKGHPVAGNVLNKDLYNDPRFQQLLKIQPDVAHKFYRAIYGRDLAQDITMQAAHEASVNKSDRDVLDKFKTSGDFDQVTGEPFIRQMINDPLNPGHQTEVKRPLSFYEKKVLDKPGAMENLTGQSRPAGMDVTSAGTNLTPQEQTQVRSKVAEFRAQFPNDPPAKLLLRARQALANPTATLTDDTRPWYIKAGDTAGQAVISTINSPGLRLPKFMGEQKPTFAVPTDAELINRYKNSSISDDLGTALYEGVNYWDTKFAPLREKIENSPFGTKY